MKKIIKTLLAITLALCVTVCAGCNFIFDFGGNTPTPGESNVMAEDIVMGTINSESRTPYATFADAVAAVERSSVAIKVGSGTYGSGTIIDVADGASNEYYVLTCHHVIESGGNITVYVPDENCRNFTDDDYNDNYAFSGTIGSQIYNKEVTLVGGDKESDVAVLKITVPSNKSNLVLVEAKTPDVNGTYKVKKAEQVFAIGNAGGLAPGTFTAGNIAYVNRVANMEGIGLMTLYQINVDIWHGNSGGSLFNMYGELIGVTNGGSDENSGINYAIPYTVTSDFTDKGFINVAKQLIATKNANPNNYGYVSGRRGQIGIQLQESYGSVSISSVTANSVAESIGLKAGDVIKYANNYTITSITDFDAVIKNLNIGDTLTLQVSRSNYLNSTNYTYSMEIPQFRFCDTGN